MYGQFMYALMYVYIYIYIIFTHTYTCTHTDPVENANRENN